MALVYGGLNFRRKIETYFAFQALGRGSLFVPLQMFVTEVD